MDDLHEILGFYSTNKVGTLWSVLYFYCNWQLSAKKKKQQHGSGREWESFFREWNGIFLQFFRGIGTGRD